MAIYSELPEILREFFVYVSTIQGKSARTVYEYYLDLRLFFRYILKMQTGSPLPVEEIDLSPLTLENIQKIGLGDLYAFMEYLYSERSDSAVTRSRKVSSIRTYYGYLVQKAKKLEYDPSRELEMPRKKKSLPVSLTLGESEQLLAAVDGEYAARDYCMLVLFLSCGMRLDELIKIDLPDIRDDTIRITGKGNKERTIYLNEMCIQAINRYLPERIKPQETDKRALFISRNRRRISRRAVQNIVEKSLVKANLDPRKFSTHKLRHTAATLMYQHEQVDTRVLQEILGHEQLSTTQIYTHVSNDQIRDATRHHPLNHQEEPPDGKE